MVHDFWFQITSNSRKRNIEREPDGQRERMKARERKIWTDRVKVKDKNEKKKRARGRENERKRVNRCLHATVWFWILQL